MLLEQDDFQLFGLTRRFGLDPTQLDARRRALHSEVHPDRFAAADAVARRAAMQTSVRVNEAYARLKDPLRRAAYLCELAGVPIGADDNTAMPVEFLNRQMAWREALDDAGTRDAVEALSTELETERRTAHARLADSLDEKREFARAAQEVRALMFVERFAADVEDRLVALEH